MHHRTFDWIRLFDAEGIEYVEGPAKDVGSDHIGIACPLCDDSGFHFGIRISDGMPRGCWRTRAHWLTSAELLRDTLRISMREAIEILNEGNTLAVSEDSMMSAIEMLKPKGRLQYETLEWPQETSLFEKRKPRNYLHWDYMEDRGFRPDALSRQYGIRWGHGDRWDCRVMFPLHSPDQELIGWTGRACTPAEIKYDTFPSGPAISSIVYEPRANQAGNLLILCEGPVDALKIDCLGRPYGVSGIALLGLRDSPGKVRHVQQIAERHKHTGICLDAGEAPQGLMIQSAVSPLETHLLTLPEGVKDPGELTARVGRLWIEGLLDRFGMAW